MRNLPSPSLRAGAALLRSSSSSASSSSASRPRSTNATIFFLPSSSPSPSSSAWISSSTPHHLASVQHSKTLPDVWFSSSSPQHQQSSERGKGASGPQPDERTVALGNTLRTLQSRLPILLASPLPQDILSPSITLHLFPSTHPHLPTVSGRVAYHAALWTAPMAWGRLPLLSDVRLTILSERMLPSPPNPREKLIVRFRTQGKTRGLGVGAAFRGIRGSERVDKITEWLGGDVSDQEEFEGLMVFEFDEGGRVGRHTIECVEEGSDADVGRVVGLTEWLLSRFGRRELGGLAVGCAREERRRE